MKDLKVVLAHDYLDGSSKNAHILEAFCEMFPEAPIYTLVYRPGTNSPIIERHKIHTSFLSRFNNARTKKRFLPLYPVAVQNLRIFENADLIISNTSSFIKGIKKPGNAKHVCYIHNSLSDAVTARDLQTPKIKKISSAFLSPYIKTWDRISNDEIDFFVADSNHVKSSVQKNYKKDADVIYPYINLSNFETYKSESPEKEDFYFLSTALNEGKDLNIIIKAFNQTGKKLKVAGTGSRATYLKSLSLENIQFIGHKKSGEITDLMAKAKAVILPISQEFDTQAIESLACGTPVISFAGNAASEVLDTNSSVTFTKPDVKSLVEAVKTFESKTFSPNYLISKIEQFNKDRFIKDFENKIESLF